MFANSHDTLGPRKTLDSPSPAHSLTPFPSFLLGPNLSNYPRSSPGIESPTPPYQRRHGPHFTQRRGLRVLERGLLHAGAAEAATPEPAVADAADQGRGEEGDAQPQRPPRLLHRARPLPGDRDRSESCCWSVNRPLLGRLCGCGTRFPRLILPLSALYRG